MTQTHTLTADQFARIGGERPCELIDGVVHEMTPAGYDHGWIAGNLHVLIGQHAMAKKLGRVCAAETGFLLARDPDTVRAPDVSFVRAERSQAAEPGYFRGAPDLAVEVVSPHDRVQDINDKVRAWLDAGTRLVWVIWPSTRSVSVHRSATTVETLAQTATLDGDQVLPGFSCRVGEIFA